MPGGHKSPPQFPLRSQGRGHPFSWGKPASQASRDWMEMPCQVYGHSALTSQIRHAQWNGETSRPSMPVSGSWDLVSSLLALERG